MKEYEIKANEWLNGDFDSQTKEAIRQLSESELEDAFYKNLEFGTGGLRGVMGVGTNRLNKYTVGMATQGLANYILKQNCKEPSVCISFDSRNNSYDFAHIAANVLSANRIKVFIFDDIRPTPELSFAIRLKGSIAGIMITASHNPKEYNGYKVFGDDGGQVTAPVDQSIISEVRKITDPSMVKFVGGDGIEIIGSEVDEQYLNALQSLSLLEHNDTRSPRPKGLAMTELLSDQEQTTARNDEAISGLKIVYTPLHGCGVKLVPELLSRIGIKNIIHIPEQDISDGNFLTVVSPNPEEASALKMAIDKAEETGADLVMATDPDADRLGIAVRDNNGKMILLNGNQTASLLTYYILSRRKELGTLDSNKYVVKTIVTTELISDIAKSFGLKTYNVLTGFKYIAEVVKRNEGIEEFVCGAEESYGFNVGEFVRDKDAQVAAMMVAECATWAASKGLTMYSLLQKIYAKYGYRKESLVSLVRKGVSGAKEIQQIMSDFRANPPKIMCGSKVVKVIDYLDTTATGQPKSNVLQFINENSDIVSVRPSGTEPKIKFYFGVKGNDADIKIEKLKKQFV